MKRIYAFAVRSCWLLALLSALPATAQAMLSVSYAGGAEPTPYTVFNGTPDDLYAIILPNNNASMAYSDNGWSAAVVSRTEWENGSFTFAGATGWAAPAPARISGGCS